MGWGRLSSLEHTESGFCSLLVNGLLLGRADIAVDDGWKLQNYASGQTHAKTVALQPALMLGRHWKRSERWTHREEQEADDGDTCQAP